MKRSLILSLLLLLVAVRGGAVLNERDLAQSLSVLHAELKASYLKQKEMMKHYRQQTQAQHQQMLETMKKSNQIALMLYSQKSDYVFDMTYACHEATQLYKKAHERQVPYTKMRERLKSEVARYDALILSLQQLPPPLVKPTGKRLVVRPATGDSLTIDTLDGMGPGPRPELAVDSAKKDRQPPFELDSVGQYDREQCLLYAKALRNNMVELSNSILKDSANYENMSSQLDTLYNYAQARYHDIQQNIFRDTGTNYFKVITRFVSQFDRAKEDFMSKYSTGGVFRSTHSDWRGPTILGYVFFVVFYLLLAVLLSNLVVRVVIKRMKFAKTEAWRKIKPYLILTAGLLIFAISVMLATRVFSQNFYKMASSLLVEYAWLLAVLSLSLLIRLKPDEVGHGFRIYMPIAIMGLIIIVFRIVFIPNNIVMLFFPPVVLGFTFWQWRSISKHHKHVPRADYYYAQISLVVMAISTVLAWYGRALLSVEVFIWWLFQLTFIQTITCVFRLIDLYEKRFLEKRMEAFRQSHTNISTSAKKGEMITVTWLYDFVRMALVPIAGVYSVLLSIYMAADVFDMSDTCMQIFLTPFLNIEGVIRLSLFSIVVVSALYFLFRYINYAIKAFYRHFRLSAYMRKNDQSHVRENEVNLTLGYNLTSILVWGAYFVICLILLKIPSSGISIVTAGLATGIGFAMKDLLNNLFYGISLMSGRLRKGDWIECDGVTGRVDNIGYQTTEVITTDDCVMSFLNSTLVSKNFKNLTRNHSYEFAKFEVGITYGEDVEKVRKVLKEDLWKIQDYDEYGRPFMDPEHGITVRLESFGDSSVNIIVAVWVLVAKRIVFMGKLKEATYNSLNAHGIEIPFPQQDVYVKTLPS